MYSLKKNFKDSLKNLKRAIKEEFEEVKRLTKNFFKKILEIPKEVKLATSQVIYGSTKTRKEYINERPLLLFFKELNQKVNTNIYGFRSMGLISIFILFGALSMVLACVRTRTVEDLRQELITNEGIKTNISSLLKYNELRDIMRKKSVFLFNSLAKREGILRLNFEAQYRMLQYLKEVGLLKSAKTKGTVPETDVVLLKELKIISRDDNLYYKSKNNQQYIVYDSKQQNL